jgi:hypothetical protein
MEEQAGIVEVGGSKYAVVKTGRAQAEQVLQLTRWIANHGIRAVKSIQAEGKKFDASNSMEFISSLLEAMTVDALIDLFIVMIGCSREDAEVYFDIGVLIDVLVEVYEKQPAVRRLVERFFSTPASEESQAE